MRIFQIGPTLNYPHLVDEDRVPNFLRTSLANVSGDCGDVGDVDDAVGDEIVAGVVGRSYKDGVEQDGVDVVQIDDAVAIEVVAGASGRFGGRCAGRGWRSPCAVLYWRCQQNCQCGMKI